MVKEYFLARDEKGLSLFDEKPHLERFISILCHYEWRDGHGCFGVPIGVGRNAGKTMFGDIKVNSYIKLISFEDRNWRIID